MYRAFPTRNGSIKICRGHHASHRSSHSKNEIFFLVPFKGNRLWFVVESMDSFSPLSGVLDASSPWTYSLTLAVALSVNSTVQWLLRPKNHPPFYWEFPYIPWLGSLVQFATQPREFLLRAAAQCGDCFTIQLFGRKMTFLFGTDGHAHFFRAKEDVFDIREACTYVRACVVESSWPRFVVMPLEWCRVDPFLIPIWFFPPSQTP